MAIFELIHTYVVHGQNCSNRYHFASDVFGTPFTGAAQELADAWIASWQTILDNFLANGGGVGTNNASVVVRSLYDPTDFGEKLNQTITPNRSGQSNPSNWVVSARSPRLLTGSNRAYKRYSGISETDVTGNAPVAGWVSLFQTWLNFLTIPAIVTDGTNTMNIDYVLLRLEKGINPTSGKVEYKPYGTEVEQRSANRTLIVPSMQYYQLTSQRTRLPGYGS